MIFNKHSDYEGKHAFLSASKYHWTNYSEDKFDRVYKAAREAQRGVEEHDLAHTLIRMGVKLPKVQKTLNMYVNDAIGFKMSPEQLLFVSDNCFGTADAIAFRKNKLRIHDLKTGVTPCSVRQLEVYAAMFCLEYDIRPFNIEIELRLYQNNEVQIYDGDPVEIFGIMDKILTFDKRIEFLKEGGL